MQRQNKPDMRVFFFLFGQHDDGDVTYFAASHHIACEDRRSKEDTMYRPWTKLHRLTALWRHCQNINRTNCKRVMVLLCIAYCGRNIWTLQHAKDEEEYFIRVAPQVRSEVLIATNTSMRIFCNGMPCKSLHTRYQYYENAVACIICHERTSKRINKSRHLKSYK
jgi:hypothetical protein